MIEPILNVHGAARAIEALRRDADAFLPSVIAPEIGESYALPANAPRCPDERRTARGITAKAS